MNLLIANMFPGMELIPLIVFCIGLFVFIILSGIFFVVTRKFFSNRRNLFIFSSFFGATPIIVFIIWSMYYISPLQLPPGATEVKIKRAFPLGLAIDDNLRFRVSPAEFRTWIETLFGKPWQSIQSSHDFEAFKDGRYTIIQPDATGQSRVGEEFSSPVLFSVGWMRRDAVKNGYLLRGMESRAFYGDILYDSDKELVYYSFWD